MKLVALTEPNGEPVYLNPEMVGRVRREDGHTYIDTTVGSQCVQESREHVRGLLEKVS